MTSAVKVALNPNTTNQPMFHSIFASRVFFRVRGRHPTLVKKGKIHDKGEYLGKFSVNVVLHHFIFVWPTLYLVIPSVVSLYQIIWTFTDPENAGFWETYLDKKKMLVISSFSCYYNIFYSTLTLSQTSPCLQYKSFENTLGKGEIARNECFLPFWITLCHCHQIWNCRLQTISVWKTFQFGRLLNLLFGKGLTKFNSFPLQMLSIWTYQKSCHLVWRYEALKYTRAFFYG